MGLAGGTVPVGRLESMFFFFYFSFFVIVVVVTFACSFVFSILSLSVCPLCMFLLYSGYHVRWNKVDILVLSHSIQYTKELTPAILVTSVHSHTLLNHQDRQLMCSTVNDIWMMYVVIVVILLLLLLIVVRSHVVDLRRYISHTWTCFFSVYFVFVNVILLISVVWRFWRQCDVLFAVSLFTSRDLIDQKIVLSLICWVVLLILLFVYASNCNESFSEFTVHGTAVIYRCFAFHCFVLFCNTTFDFDTF